MQNFMQRFVQIAAVLLLMLAAVSMVFHFAGTNAGANEGQVDTLLQFVLLISSLVSLAVGLFLLWIGRRGGASFTLKSASVLLVLLLVIQFALFSMRLEERSQGDFEKTSDESKSALGSMYDDGDNSDVETDSDRD